MHRVFLFCALHLSVMHRGSEAKVRLGAYLLKVFEQYKTLKQNSNHLKVFIIQGTPLK